jgi:hypothetical protein
MEGRDAGDAERQDQPPFTSLRRNNRAATKSANPASVA